MSRSRGASSVTSRSPIEIVARRHLLEPGDQAQQRRLAAAGGADEHHELAVLDVQRHVVDRDHAAGELLRHPLDQDLGHVVTYAATRSWPPTRTVRISSSSSRTTTSAAGTRPQRAERRSAHHARRHGGRGLDGVRERDVQRVQRPHGLDQRQRATGEHAVGTPGDSVADLDLDVAEPEDAVAHARGRDRVRDEGDPAGRRPPDDASRLVGEVVAVEDDLDDDVVARERGAGDAGIAVLQRPHRVEEVGDGGGAAVERTSRLLGGRVGVTARDDDTPARQHVDQLERAVELRRERHRGHGPGVEETCEQRRVRVACARRRVRAEPDRREERAFEVRADHARADRLTRNLRQRGDELGLGRGDQRRLERGDAALEQRLAGPPVRRVRRRRRSRRRRCRSPAGRRDRGSRCRGPESRSARRPRSRPSAISTSPRRSRPSTTAAATPEPHDPGLQRRADGTAGRVEPLACGLRVETGQEGDDRDLRVAVRRGEGGVDLLVRDGRSRARRRAVRGRGAWRCSRRRRP